MTSRGPGPAPVAPGLGDPWGILGVGSGAPCPGYAGMARARDGPGPVAICGLGSPPGAPPNPMGDPEATDSDSDPFFGRPPPDPLAVDPGWVGGRRSGGGKPNIVVVSRPKPFYSVFPRGKGGKGNGGPAPPARGVGGRGVLSRSKPVYSVFPQGGGERATGAPAPRR